MAERERLIELLLEHTDNAFNISEDKHFVHSTTIGKIADTLLANGVIVPPCKVGDTIYIVGLGEVEAGVVVSMTFEYNVSGLESECLAVGKHTIEFAFRNIGKTVFLTKEEAEQALVTYTNVGSKKEERSV